jgi:Domain of unknown function (DUF4440)
VNDASELERLNEQFIEAFRQGSWELLAPILAPSFAYLDGATGEVWEQERYIDNLRSHPAPTLALDQVVMHIDHDHAAVSGRTSRQPGTYRRYLDTYERQPEGWRCIHACVWPLETRAPESAEDAQLAGDAQLADARTARV